MAHSPLDEIEELTLCPCCRRPFDEDEHAPKLLACRHHFCLRCARTVLGPGREIYCAHCWKRTSPPGGQVEALPTHAALLALTRHFAPDPACTEHAQPALWCLSCGVRACRACPDHSTHTLRSPGEARAVLRAESKELRADLQRLAVRQRDLLLRALDATTALKLRLENQLAAPPLDHYPAAEACSLRACAAERDVLKVRHAEALVQARVDDLIRSAPAPLDFDSLTRALRITETWAASPAPGPGDPLVLLANYCAAQVWARTTHGRVEDGGCETATVEKGGQGRETPAVRAPTPFPLFYFELEVDGSPFGRIVIEVREDVAPRMARNFAALTTREPGSGYRGCAVFQCWENESVITGDFEHNNGRGGRSAFEETYFMPDETRLAAVRGSVGMRRSQKRHDNQGLVGSQFRIVLREMRGFTAIFAAVVEGLELVDRLSRTGDSAGKPSSTILISACGKLN
ncbi:uncharacterized protein LOC114248719 [Bombyx mandarina]|uniref:Peptidyl-prolyl cis-trans isomerase n=2 Tax=Bombyx TaxID=7090 RepID=A0A8R2C613_BOMMO|nr:uncharacterized protein LOC101746142 [Bombyx mori]XP_028037903.1 uncharacterized protein LOC114248719 [Bombyx mandarina]